MNDLATAVKLEVDGNFTQALPILEQPNVQQGMLGHYAQYYQGFAELRLGRPADARQTFQALGAEERRSASSPKPRDARGGIGRSARRSGGRARDLRAPRENENHRARRRADAAGASGESDRQHGEGDRGVLARASTNSRSATSRRSPSSELEALPIAPLVAGSNRYKLELGRGERLFGASRYAQARVVFDGLRTAAQGDDRELVQLRLAECDYFQKQARAGARRRQAVHREGVAPGRGALFLRGGQPRARRPRRVPARRAPAGQRVPDAELGRRSAEQPRHALHPPERRRERRPGVPRAVREVSGRPLRGARRVEDRAGGRTRTAATPRPCACSSRRRRSFRAPTTGRRGCTGRRARTRR